MELGNKEPKTIDNKDPMTLVQFLLLITLSVVFALIGVWIGPVLAVVLSLGTAGIVLVLVRRLRPLWIKAFWSWCIDVGQNLLLRPKRSDRSQKLPTARVMSLLCASSSSKEPTEACLMCSASTLQYGLEANR